MPRLLSTQGGDRRTGSGRPQPPTPTPEEPAATHKTTTGPAWPARRPSGPPAATDDGQVGPRTPARPQQPLWDQERRRGGGGLSPGLRCLSTQLHADRGHRVRAACCPRVRSGFASGSRLRGGRGQNASGPRTSSERDAGFPPGTRGMRPKSWVTRP